MWIHEIKTEDLNAIYFAMMIKNKTINNRVVLIDFTKVCNN